jgi:hypothetical protein
VNAKGLMRPEGLGHVIKFSYLVRSGTRELPACSSVSTTMLSHVPFAYL